MKIALYSDLHLENALWYPPEAAVEADVVILAGDIAKHSEGVEWAREAFTQPVIYVAGNHEYYGKDLEFPHVMRQVAIPPLVFLEQEVHVIGKVRFLGCTLWSGFDLMIAEEDRAWAMHDAEECIPDFQAIWKDDKSLLTPQEMVRQHQASVQWLDQALAEPFDGKTVVITHFAPHPGCISPQFKQNRLTAYFVNDHTALMQRHCIDLWCHGHTHSSTDFIAENGCRVVSNQRGYPPEKNTCGIREDLLIDL